MQGAGGAGARGESDALPVAVVAEVAAPAPAPAPAAQSILREGLPVLLTAFVNKCGAIGLSLLPMLLVERQLSSADSSLVMGLVKATVVAGTFLGGWMADRAGLRASLIFSFAASAVGLGLMPFAPGLGLLCALAMLAQTGNAMFHSPARLLITSLVAPGRQQEAIGWLRSAVNLGNIVSFSIGWLFTTAGIAALMVFNAATALVAAGVGLKILPKPAPRPLSRPAAPETAPAAMTPSGWKLFFGCALLLFAFSFQMELFMVGAAARFKLLYGAEGLPLFSRLMVVNTVLCTVFAVYAARMFTNPARAFPLGMLLIGVGSATVLGGGGNAGLQYAGAFVLTAGEIVFAALAQFVMMRVSPPGPRQGSWYALALVIQSVGRIVGAGIAFPLVVHGSRPLLVIAVATAAFVGLALAVSPGLRRQAAAA